MLVPSRGPEFERHGVAHWRKSITVNAATPRTEIKPATITASDHGRPSPFFAGTVWASLRPRQLSGSPTPPPQPPWVTSSRILISRIRWTLSQQTVSRHSQNQATSFRRLFTISPKGITVAASGSAGIRPGSTIAMKSLDCIGSTFIFRMISKLLPRSARD